MIERGARKKQIRIEKEREREGERGGAREIGVEEVVVREMTRGGGGGGGGKH